MMAMRIMPASLALALLALTGCGEGEPQGKPRQIGIAHPFHERLQALSPLNRDLALRRAIQDSGATCQRVEQSAHQEEYRGMQMWVARCADARSWALFIAPDGDVQVRSCADMEQLALPLCRLEEPPAAG